MRRAADAGKPLRRALSSACTAATCTRRSLACCRRSIVHLGKKLVGLDQRAAASRWPSPTAPRRGRRRDRRRRPALARARDPRSGPTSRIHSGRVAYRAVFRRRSDERRRHRPVAHEVVGRRPPHRHLLHHRRPQRGLLRHQRARAGRMADPRIVVRQGRRQRAARRLRRLPSGRARRCSTPAPTATSGRSSTATRCRAGATAASCCSAMPATR